MALPASALPLPYLLIESGTSEPSRVVLERPAYRLGRAPANELCFPQDSGLSRSHLVFERRGSQWWVRDAGSANGTLLNGVKLSEMSPLQDGDKIVAGHLAIRYASGDGSGIKLAPQPKTITTDLTDALQLKSSQPEHWRAVLQASRELVSYRPLNELFEVILRLGVQAARASAAALLTYDGEEVVTRARHGAGLQISSTVVNRVLRERVSVLIRDTGVDDFASGQQSIVIGRIKSVVAVPLQTDAGVIGLLYADLRGEESFSSEDLNLLTVLANVAAIRVEQARLIELEQERKLLARDLEQAAQIQRSLLPEHAPAVSGFEIAGFNTPSRTVGGDYYDFFALPGGEVCLVVADVAGKGMPAALLMASLHAMVKVIFDGADDLAGRMGRLNRAVCRACPSDRFITCFVGVLHPDTGRMEYCNAGHNPPLILRVSGHNDLLGATGIVLGLLPALAYESGSCDLAPGDVLVLYSDGITEACSPSTDEEFGEEKLTTVVRNEREKGVAAILDAIRRELAAYTHDAPPTDDLTIVVGKRV